MGRITQVRKHGRRVRKGVTTVTKHWRKLPRGRKAAVGGIFTGAVVGGAIIATRGKLLKRLIERDLAIYASREGFNPRTYQDVKVNLKKGTYRYKVVFPKYSWKSKVLDEDSYNILEGKLNKLGYSREGAKTIKKVRDGKIV